MSVVNQMANPMNPAQPFNFARGRIKFISIKPHKAGGKDVNEDGVKVSWIRVKGQPDKKVESTHVASVLMQETDDKNQLVEGGEEVWIGLGDQKLHPSHADKLQIKVGETWKQIQAGMVVTIPLKISQVGDKTYINGNKAKMAILDESGVQEAQSAPAGGAARPTVSGNKVYGEVTAIVDGVATVADKAGEKKVILGDNSVEVGHRMTAFIDAEGNITSGFKTYLPTQQRAAKDDLPVRLGNAVTIVHAMFPDKEVEVQGVEVTQILSVMDQLRNKLTVEFSDMDAYALGARLGQSGIVAAPFGRKSPEDFATKTEATFRMICALETSIRAEKAGAPAEPVKETKPKVKSTPKSAPVPPVVEPEYDSPMDFDDDIPF